MARDGQRGGGEVALAREAVEPAAADHARLERAEKSLLVDAAASGGVDQERVGTHECELARADEVLGLGDERAVQAHDVSAGEQLVEGVGLLDAGGGELCGGLGGCPREDAHAEGARDGNDGAGDAAEVDEAERLRRRAVHGVAEVRVPTPLDDLAV